MLSNGQAQIVFEGNTMSSSVSGSSNDSAIPGAAAATLTAASSAYSLTDDDTEPKTLPRRSSYNSEMAQIYQQRCPAYWSPNSRGHIQGRSQKSSIFTALEALQVNQQSAIVSGLI